MNKEQALHSFWSSFGVPAYDENTVPDDAKLPYITYQVVTDNYDAVTPLNASIWDKSDSWGKVTDLSHEVAQRLNEMGCIKIDDGWLHISRGSPFAQRMGEQDRTIRRVSINVYAQFLTEI